MRKAGSYSLKTPPGDEICFTISSELPRYDVGSSVSNHGSTLEGSDAKKQIVVATLAYPDGRR